MAKHTKARCVETRCTRPVYARSRCKSHYEKRRLTGGAGDVLVPVIDIYGHEVEGRFRREPAAGWGRAVRRHGQAQVDGYKRQIDAWKAAGFHYLSVLARGSQITQHRIAGRCVGEAINGAIDNAAELSPSNTLIESYRCDDCIRRAT